MPKAKILFIDDEMDYCAIMKSYFTKKEYEVFLAHDLSSGLELLHNIVPDILFLDNNLPDGKGWEHVDDIVRDHPSLKLYLASGYHHGANIYSSIPQVTVWEKPLSMSLLNATF
jgi:DNA-binding NtrC family response regulator